MRGEEGNDFQITGHSPVSGGCIHNAQKLETTSGTWFLKYNHLRERENFEAEANGLQRLWASRSMYVPRIWDIGYDTEYAWILMEFIESGPRSPYFWQLFGAALAKLHQHHSQQFGLEKNNFIGRLPQQNDFRQTWPEFFTEMRLEPQLKLARDKGLADKSLSDAFEKLYPKLASLMPDERPSLLHGDLWSGNFMTGPDGFVAVFDPAVYYGHREAELAFTRLFGGFDDLFYNAYNIAFPLQPGWESRVDLFNLYPLMVHLNLFGRSYLPEIQNTLNRYR